MSPAKYPYPIHCIDSFIGISQLWCITIPDQPLSRTSYMTLFQSNIAMQNGSVTDG